MIIKRAIFLLAWAIYLPIALADKPVLNVYNWSNYMPPEVLSQFQRETGIHVNYTEFDSNGALYAKLKTNPKIGFDIIVPGSYYIPRMVEEGMLLPLDHDKIPNMRYLNPDAPRRPYDPDNSYSLPYTWGVTGIAVNNRYHNAKKIKTWSDLWNSDFKNQLLMLDDMREVFSIPLMMMGYSINDTDPEHIKQAYEKLRALLPNIRLFSTAPQSIYVDEDATIGMVWNGDAFQAEHENKNLVFVYPSDGLVLWVDTIAIPRYAPHVENAYQFLNFINRPDVAAKIAIYNGYSSPNKAALELLPKAIRDNPVFNPPSDIVKDAVMENDLGPANAIYEKYWQLLKMG